jgi:hypothetical protein
MRKPPPAVDGVVRWPAAHEPVETFDATVARLLPCSASQPV